jgi:hypothetical protein
MTSALLLARDCIIYSVNVWLVPVECTFNIIESELTRRGSTFTRPKSPQCAPRDALSRCSHLVAKLTLLHPWTWAI